MNDKDLNIETIKTQLDQKNMSLPMDIVLFIGFEVSKLSLSQPDKIPYVSPENIFVTSDGQVMVVPHGDKHGHSLGESLCSLIQFMVKNSSYDTNTPGFEELIQKTNDLSSNQRTTAEDFKLLFQKIEREHYRNPNILRKVSRWINQFEYKVEQDSNVLSFAQAQKSQYLLAQKKLYKTSQIAKAILLTSFVAVIINFVQTFNSSQNTRDVASVNDFDRTFSDIEIDIKENRFDLAEDALSAIEKENRGAEWVSSMEELVLGKVRSILKDGYLNEKTRQEKMVELILNYQDLYPELKSSERLNRLLSQDQ